MKEKEDSQMVVHADLVISNHQVVVLDSINMPMTSFVKPSLDGRSWLADLAVADIGFDS